MWCSSHDQHVTPSAPARTAGPERQVGGQVEAVAAGRGQQRSASVVGGRRRRRSGRSPRRARRTSWLVRLARRRPGRPCAAPRAGRRTSPQRRAQRVGVEVAVQPQRRAGCCTSRSGPPAGRGTTAAAGRRQRQPFGRAPGRAAARAGACAGVGASVAGQRRPTVGASNTSRSDSSTPSAGADPADQPGGQQRVAAEGEEVVVDADPRPAPSTSANRPHSDLLACVGGRGRRPRRRRGPARAAPGGRACRWRSAAARPARRRPAGTM